MAHATEHFRFRGMEHVWGGSENIPVERRILVALIGAGCGAQEVYGPIILQNPSFHLKAIWSRSQASAENFNLHTAGRSLEAFWGEEGFKRLLGRCDIEAYAVVLPPVVQAEYITRILLQNRHVYSEKPVAPNRELAHEKMQQLEDVSNSRTTPTWFVSDHLRHEPIFDTLQEVLVEIGAICACELHSVLVVGDDEASKTDEELWIEGGVQNIALLRSLFGQVTQANCWRASDHVLRSDRRARDDQSSAVDHSPPQTVAFWTDSLSGTLQFECGAVCVVNWQTSRSRADERFRLVCWGASGSAVVELETGPQVGDLRRFSLNKSSQTGPFCLDAAGADRQLRAWGRAIRGANEDTDCSPLHGIVDVIVVGAMLNSGGTAVQIREKPRTRRIP